MRYLMAVGALALLTACANQYGPDQGPNYVKPGAANLNLNYLSLSDRNVACAPAGERRCTTSRH
jgi:hypothetical protein